MQAYTNPLREYDPYSLPDLEVFHHECSEGPDSCMRDDNGECTGEGYYWWPCFPGCLPDGEAHGPFATEEEALADARDD